jgi:hypothetical protein
MREAITNQRAIRSVLVLAGSVALAACGGVVVAEQATIMAESAAVTRLSRADAQERVHGLVRTSDGRDPYASARDPGTGEFIRDVGTGELFFPVAATPLTAAQHLVLSSDGRDPYASARDPGTGEFVLDIGTGEPLR